MRDTAGGTPALPFEEAASSSLPQSPISNILSLFILCVPWRPWCLGGESFLKESAVGMKRICSEFIRLYMFLVINGYKWQ
jgi:hypothetical protein